ncbi:MAG: hypothetical protein IH950_07395 [Bacteroidetes bacterium]|nr:hypothetical protein [Bacteroidota bacterium]
MLILCLLFILLPYETFKEFPEYGTNIQPSIHTSIPQSGGHSFFPTGFT